MEAQIEESRTARSSKNKRALKAEQVQSHFKKADLLLSRSRVVQQLELSTNDRFNELMQRTLKDLDRQLAALPD